MQRSKRILRLLGMPAMLVFVSAGLAGCFLDESESTTGFPVFTRDVIFTGGAPVSSPQGDVLVLGTYVSTAANTLTIGTAKKINVTTDSSGFAGTNGIDNSTWTSTVVWAGPCGGPGGPTGATETTLVKSILEWDCDQVRLLPSVQFSTTNSLPASISFSGGAFSTTYGPPRLNVYNNSDDSLAAQTYANSVSGSTVVFNFPQSSSGPLSAGVYAFNIWNAGAGGLYTDVGANFLSIGSVDSTHISPYGVDAVTLTSGTRTCGVPCTATSTVTPVPITTLSASAQLAYKGQLVTVGASPVAVKAYDYVTTSTQHCGGGRNPVCVTNSSTAPTAAIVANFGSNTVSIVTLTSTPTVATTIPVGIEPSSIALTSNQSYAYVTNFGSDSVSEINLSTHAVTRTIAVGAQPAAVLVDPGGSNLWVGGLNYISEISLSSLATVGGVSGVSGQVTSLGVSTGTNSVIYTTISSNLSTYQAIQAAISAVGPTGKLAPPANPQNSYASMNVSGTAYAVFNPGSTSPPGFLASSGALVNANYGNGLAVVGTPTGFAVLDLVHNTQVFQSSTTTPVRGIATNPAQGVVYLTVPDSNQLITVPLPAIN